ncbi:hypothetical protein [Paracoccus hibiscisoli]|uniref:Uncharacterized protein n=1 Tax=Paracoccus hibiscisoli TaxID=2023261 RepID=A0A4U0Q685_9RHOB|nr:hypothetical protein [Paracoccus hibiscisoli]TJZ76619.1 hypothetical protein FA740_19390 [Paracoccus hibiscisoli]
MKTSLGFLIAIVCSAGMAAAQTIIAPDGTHVGGTSTIIAPDGTHVGGTSTIIAPDGTHVGTED